MEFLRLYRNLILKSTFAFTTLLISLITYSHIVGAALTSPVTLGAKEKGLVPDVFLYPNIENAKYMLLVEKISQKAYLYDLNNIDQPLKDYPCSTGENAGPKANKNDKKTPEGVYFVTNSFREKDLTSIYGARAFPIDYPSPRDSKLGREGYGIWIHGRDQGLKPRDTNGCIAFRNEDIIELSNHIDKRFTPIIVTGKINFISKKELERESSELKRFIMDWIEVWKKGEIDIYMSNYSKDFTAQGKNWDQWRAYKSHLSKKYGAVDIKIDSLEILRENGIVLAKFDQVYDASRFYSVGEKRLYLQKNVEKWEIIDEFFKQEKELSKEPTSPTSEKQEDLSAIENLISNWRKAWQEKDLEGYMDSYATDFFSQGLNREDWGIYKSEIIKQYSQIKVNMSNLKIDLLSPDKAKITFIQEYYADKYSDKGKKTIKLIKKNGKWKIRSETWIPLIKEKVR
ncbi:MAG TPA: L,D-transpeptidase family protein [Desulfatiglandales bacterium]|nr:L,D-transpeptidase family protein [Desulfatiglandales bacterium]